MDDYCQVFTALVNSYDDSVQLENFASQYGLRDDPQVQARLLYLLDRDVSNMASDIDAFNEASEVQDDISPNKRGRFLETGYTSKQMGGAEATASTSKQTGGADVTASKTNDDNNSQKPYIVENTKQRTFKKTLATDTSFKVKFNEQWQGEKLRDLTGELHDMFDDVLSQARGHNADLGRVVIEHPSLSDPIVVPLQPWENIDADEVMDQISKVLNSDEELELDENMTVTVGSINLPKGGAKKPVTRLYGSENSLKKKTSVFYIENDNNLCLALSVGLCFLKICKHVDEDTWNNITINDKGSKLESILKHKTVQRQYYRDLLDKKRKKLRTDLAFRLCQLTILPTTRSQTMPDLEKKPLKKFLFYDFETRQDEVMSCSQGYTPARTRCRKCVGTSSKCESCKRCTKCGENTCGLYQHLVNFAVLQTSCDLCQDDDVTPESKCINCGRRCQTCGKRDKSGEFERWPCTDTCGHRETIFKGDETMTQFCDYITQEHFTNYTLLAHNAKSFDLYPVLENLIDRHAMKPDKIIYSGSKIMYMYIGNKLNLRFLDSLNFLPGQLSKLPQLFELEELCKGFFPHKFNTKGNQNYSGRFPPPEDYGYETMSSARRKDFLLWYREKESETFHFQTEMLKYCRSDVDILRRACLKFRKLMLEVTHGIDPFDYVTIASVCMGIFKTLFLKKSMKEK
ncbi:hypothetical protein FSP39_023320 [Pinctada imbricata]|uniref:DNA-directed DNA polymerase n=1 Tax=Pinctada imbricata TaxID=66713 RepID=A0AA88Y9P2_PINIB|nr:hypothetical protein FSP39_023320 [Pinctada imbricata]